MKMELMKGDSLKVSDDTPKYNPQGLPFKKLRLNNKIFCRIIFLNVYRNA